MIVSFKYFSNILRGIGYQQKSNPPMFNFAESLIESRKKKIHDNIAVSKQTTEDRTAIMLKANYWERWTGSRFVREENPTIAMTPRQFMRSEWSKNHSIHKPKIDLGTVVRSCPVTGDWNSL